MKEYWVRHVAAGIIWVLLLSASILAGCGSKDVLQDVSPETRFEHAKALFDNEDYLQAINEFTVLTLQYQGSAVAGDAQYYLAESRFKRGEFLLASYEYQTLRRNMPASPRVSEAQYKLGLCFYNLSPRSRLDQQYTKRAIDELQAFVEYYPQSEFVPDASEKIQELTLRLAKKDFDTAELYSKMEYNKAALLYYDIVIEKYHDTEYAPLAYLGKTELLIKRKRFPEAKATITKFLQLYPNSILRGRAERLNEQVEARLKDVPAAGGNESGTAGGTAAGAALLQKR